MGERTSGPWSWHRGEKWHRLHGIGPDKKLVTILRVAQNNGQVMTPTKRADQELIAAAPELLGVCKDALKMARIQEGWAHYKAEWSALVANLEDAISKAEGAK